MNEHIHNELSEISKAVANIGNTNLYSLPDNYFEFLADEILLKIALPAAKTPFQLPDANYFETFADRVLNKIKQQQVAITGNEATIELQQLSPLLYSIGKANVYTVPEGYFYSLQTTVPIAKQPAVVVKVNSFKWLKYAAAASIAGIIAVSAWLFSNNSAGNQYSLDKNYRQQISKLSDDELASYLDNTTTDVDVTASSYESNIPAGNNLIKQLLNNVSDDEIQQYLDENAETGEKDIKGI